MSDEVRKKHITKRNERIPVRSDHTVSHAPDIADGWRKATRNSLLYQDHPSSGRNAMVFRIGFFVCAPGSPVQVTVQFMAYDTNFSLLIACMFMLLYNRPKKKRPHNRRLCGHSWIPFNFLREDGTWANPFETPFNQTFAIFCSYQETIRIPSYELPPGTVH